MILDDFFFAQKSHFFHILVPPLENSLSTFRLAAGLVGGLGAGKKKCSDHDFYDRESVY